MTKEESNKDVYIRDFISKVNDFQMTFTMTNFFADKDSIYFFMNSPVDNAAMNSFI